MNSLEAKLNAQHQSLRIIVIQMGARMHYAVPALLARAGMLEHFYTDICGNVGMFKYLNHILPSFLLPKAFKRLLGRKLPSEISKEKLTTCSTIALINAIQNKAKKTEQRLKNIILRDNFRHANALYTNFINSDIDIVTIAKKRGLKIIHEVILNPDAGIIINEERNRFPGLENEDDQKKLETGIERDKKKWSLSDLILVPSRFVYESVTRLGAEPERIKIVPYGIDSDWLEEIPCPKRGRVLFVGSVGLRKGNHYLAQATRLLHKRGVDCEVRVVGPCEQGNPKIIESPEFYGPKYIGQIPRSEVRKEFLEADIFVLPTLSDSFALVHLEAMACGVPVITTTNCGSVVRDGIEGFIIPIRDPVILADRMEQLLSNESLRRQMSIKAKERAKQFTWDKYEERLITTLNSLKDRNDA